MPDAQDGGPSAGSGGSWFCGAERVPCGRQPIARAAASGVAGILSADVHGGTTAVIFARVFGSRNFASENLLGVGSGSRASSMARLCVIHSLVTAYETRNCNCAGGRRRGGSAGILLR